MSNNYIKVLSLTELYATLIKEGKRKLNHTNISCLIVRCMKSEFNIFNKLYINIKDLNLSKL